MKLTTPTDYVPDVADVMSVSRSATLAEKLASQNYNWDCLAEFLGDSTTPEDVSETLMIVFFEFSRLLILNPCETTSDANNLLFRLQEICMVFRRMGKEGQGTLALVSIADHVEPQN